MVNKNGSLACIICHIDDDRAVYLKRAECYVHPECALYQMTLDNRDERLPRIADSLDSVLNMRYSVREIVARFKTARSITIQQGSYKATYSLNGGVWSIDGLMFTPVYMLELLVTNLKDEKDVTVKFV